MKKLGLVGGTGPESTLIYYRDINYSIHEKTQKRAFPELSIENINIYEAINYIEEKQYDKLVEYLLNSINNLSNAGAEFAALTANTVHIVFDSLKEKSPIPLISIVDTVCEEAKRRGLKKIGLLGTIFTMKGQFFKDVFTREGIEIITPNEEKMQLVNSIIANELEIGIIKEESTQKLINVIEDLKKEQEIESIILGCTELPLAVNDENSPLPCLDTMKIHIDKLVELMIGR